MNCQKKTREAANEILAILPHLLGPVRYSGIQNSVILGFFNGIVAITNFGLGIPILKDKVKAND
ncbi:MAG: hypothetical protein AAGJ37_11175 [Pseudomonadota bacterium]